MSNSFKKIIVSRSLVIAEILLVTAAILIAETIPQRFLSSAAAISQWRFHHAILARLADFLHLHSVYTSYWFLLIITLAGLSLSFSLIEQIRLTRRRIKSFSAPGLAFATLSTLTPELEQKLAKGGYRRQRCDQNKDCKFIHCSWGYWGIVLFHIGMLVVIGASLYSALTERRGSLAIAQHEMLTPADEWVNTEEGLLATKLQLPATLRYDDLRIRYDDKNVPEHIESLVTFIRSDGLEEQRSVVVNGDIRYQSLRLYHTNEYGDAFTLEFIHSDGTRHLEKILLEHPAAPDEASFLDTTLSWLPFTLSLKYFTDVERRSMASPNRQLVMRLMKGKQENSRVTLLSGQSGQLGDYQVHLLAIEKWAKLVVVDVKGITIIFSGFTLMMFGLLMSYMTPPRELSFLRQEDGSYVVYWRATRFAEFYAEERATLLDLLQPAV